MRRKTPTQNLIPQKANFKPHDLAQKGNGDRAKLCEVQRVLSEAIFGVKNAINLITPLHSSESNYLPFSMLTITNCSVGFDRSRSA